MRSLRESEICLTVHERESPSFTSYDKTDYCLVFNTLTSFLILIVQSTLLTRSKFVCPLQSCGRRRATLSDHHVDGARASVSWDVDPHRVRDLVLILFRYLNSLQVCYLCYFQIELDLSLHCDDITVLL